MPKNQKSWLRFSTRFLLVLTTIAAILFGGIGIEITKGQARTVIVNRLAEIGVSVWRHQPTTIGHLTAHLPVSFQESLSRAFGEPLLKSPATILATEVTVQEVEVLLKEAATLDSLESIVVMENQLPPEELDRIRRRLPHIELTEAAFISGAIFLR